MTLDQMFEGFRKASLSSLQMQQEMFKQWTQQWPATTPSSAGISTDWLQKIQKRWIEFMTESLDRHRSSLDSLYRALVQVVEEGARLSDAKTPDDYRRTTEAVRQKLIATFKEHSETQIREFQKNAEKWFEVFPIA
ncbi:MAG TPA: hypothetical protein VJT73_17015 [Polyangiaceae bacterium]|nr:hypothetical protein [Polyangiaceae bacterium]